MFALPPKADISLTSYVTGLRLACGHWQCKKACPLYTRKRTYAVQQGMSALPPRADIGSAQPHVRFVPIADIRQMTRGSRKTASRRSLRNFNEGALSFIFGFDTRRRSQCPRRPNLTGRLLSMVQEPRQAPLPEPVCLQRQRMQFRLLDVQTLCALPNSFDKGSLSYKCHPNT